MKLSGIAAVTAAAMMSATLAFAQAKPAANATETKLMANEQAVAAAFQKKDTATIKKFIMPGSWSVDEGGAMKVDDMIASIADMKVDTYKISDMKVIAVNATTSLVTYKMDQKGSFKGQPFAPVVYATTVWTDHGGGNWMAVFHQESTAAPPPKK